ncbi:hypothetical protein UlMin_015269 [Ulmus minor]
MKEGSKCPFARWVKSMCQDFIHLCVVLPFFQMPNIYNAPSGEVHLIPKTCSATVEKVGNVGMNQKSLGRAGSKCWLGKHHVVRGVVMNPKKKPATPRGYPALGRRSKKRNKYIDNLILHHHSK